MCCATLLPRISWRAGQTCGSCRRFWAMPISPPPRSTRMSTRRGSSPWSTSGILLRAAGTGPNARPMISYLEFEKPVAELENRIAELRLASEGDDVDISSELLRLERKSLELLTSTYAGLTPWPKTQVARHPSRPHFRDYVAMAFDDFVPLGADRHFADDLAILAGFASLGGRKLTPSGHEKGHHTESRLKHKFGMGKPEGYRKAVRLMELAGCFALPVVTLVDTSGAFPGVEAEERGQAEAIARSTEACLALPVPMVAAIVG